MNGSRWTLTLLGLWAAASAFLGFGSEGYLWNNLLVGLFVLFAGVPLGTEAKWEGWTEGVLGLWLILAAFLPGLREGAAVMWNNVIVGLAVAGTALVVPPPRTPRHA